MAGVIGRNHEVTEARLLRMSAQEIRTLAESRGYPQISQYAGRRTAAQAFLAHQASDPVELEEAPAEPEAPAPKRRFRSLKEESPELAEGLESQDED